MRRLYKLGYEHTSLCAPQTDFPERRVKLLELHNDQTKGNEIDATRRPENIHASNIQHFIPVYSDVYIFIQNGRRSKKSCACSECICAKVYLHWTPKPPFCLENDRNLEPSVKKKGVWYMMKTSMSGPPSRNRREVCIYMRKYVFEKKNAQHLVIHKSSSIILPHQDSKHIDTHQHRTSHSDNSDNNKDHTSTHSLPLFINLSNSIVRSASTNRQM